MLISNLTRVELGTTANAIDPYQTVGFAWVTPIIRSIMRVYGFYPKTMSNKELTWETTTQYNLGLDFGFF